MTLGDALRRLNDKQRQAVESEVDTAVLAGPGSGKTDTLATKAALVLSSVQPPRGVACITYTRAAAAEIRGRVETLGVFPGRRLVATTAHSFCLNQIIKPYALLAGDQAAAVRRPIRRQEAQALLNEANEELGGRRLRPEGLARIRRAMAAGELLGTVPYQQQRIAQRYVELLHERSQTDFDGMIHDALGILESHPVVADLCASRFAWLLVDEYQDLGGPLHRIVELLRSSGATKVFAVGDPDQTILQFTGADSRYLEGLEDDGFSCVELEINYRSGSEIIAAAGVVLQAGRGFIADPDRADPGEVIWHSEPGGLHAQAEFALTSLLPRFDAADRRREEVAFLYPRKGPVLDAIQAALDRHRIPFSNERDPRLAIEGEIVSWLQRCAQWALDGWDLRPGRFQPLVSEYQRYLATAGHPAGGSRLDAATLLLGALDERPSSDCALSEWLDRVVAALGLTELLVAAPDLNDDADALDELLTASGGRLNALPLVTFADPVRQPGKIVVTNYHSSKGREFDSVVLLGLQDGIVPFAFRDGTVPSLESDRKLFYVAATRARHTLALLWSDDSPQLGRRSRFVDPPLSG